MSSDRPRPPHALPHRLVAVALLTWSSTSAVAVTPDLPAGDAAAPLADAPIAAKVHPALASAVTQNDEPVKAWVFFTDKGVRSRAEYDYALHQVERTYSRRAIWRRSIRGDNASRGGALFDTRDLPVASAYVDEIERTGARVHARSQWLNAISIWVRYDQLDDIAALPFVRELRLVAKGRRVDRTLDAGPPVAGPRRSARGTPDYGLATEQLTQINLIALHSAGATGNGVIIGMLDTGFRQDHVAFNHPLSPLTVVAEYDFINNDGNTDIEPGDPSAQHFHGTLILGTVASYAPGDLIGAAYNASYILCKTEDTTAEYPAEEDNYVAGVEFIEANGGDVVNSSLGYIDWYTQDDLDGRTAVTTIAVNIATANGVHFCTSAGNSGNDTDPTTSHLIAPADAWQVLTCGAVDSTGASSPISSDGPSADGRVKPEVMARGVDTFTIGAYDTTTYNSATGTSISSPLVAGSVACLVELHPDWTVDQMRAVLFNSADYYFNNDTHDPLFVRGYGVINAHAAGLDCNLNGIPDECDIDCGPAAGPCDLPGCGFSADCNADGIPDDCEPDCNGNGVADGCDLASCAPGDAACQDCNRNGLPDECDDPFPQQGRITLDSQSYVCEATAWITVSDCGLDTDTGIVESMQVHLQSDTEPLGELVMLTETGPATGRFEGSIALSLTDATGVLLVSHSDAVTAAYVDADDGFGGIDVTVTDQAFVDCNPPVPSDLQAAVTGPFSAVVSFTTDEPAIATVRFGLACGALDLQAGDTQFLTSFAIPLASLTATSTYFFVIDLEDELGNAITDDNGGTCYSFQTPEIPDYYTEHFDGNDNDLDFRTLLFTPDGSPDIYAPCRYDIVELPTDPTGGTTLTLAIDDFATVALPAGDMVSLYGVSYSTFYVGSNGYITFGSGDDEWSDTLAHHFALPRIAALFDDLDPTQGGTISWKPLNDRIAVTWQDVPEYLSTNNNTFQVEMYFDGRIRVSYLSLDTTDGLAGLSAGTGVVPGFVETDLSALSDCGPQPPAAADSNVTTEVDTNVLIALQAGDDGQPDPPGALAYTILTLPAYGTLTDPGVGVIAAAPYTLAAGDGMVGYIPGPEFSGADGFQFKVSDGGLPPDGGDSNTATVSITVGSPQAIHSFNMDVDPGWITEGQWAFGQPTGGGSHDGDPTTGHTSANVYGYNLDGDYPLNLPPTHLTSAPLDCSGVMRTELRFRRWLGVESSNFDHATVSASNDGSTWITIWDHDGGAISDTAWVAQSFDISAVADGQASVQLRWTMGPTDDFVTYPGWNIDDVQLWAVRVNPPCEAGHVGTCEGGNDGAPCDPCGDGSECGGGICVPLAGGGAIPTLGTWGVAVMTLVMVSAGTLVYRRRYVTK